MICDEQDKIQNLQLQEISNLKNLLLFREQVRFLQVSKFNQHYIFCLFQESIDRISVLKQSQQQAASLKTELMRIKDLEPMFEDAKVFILNTLLLFLIIFSGHFIYCEFKKVLAVCFVFLFVFFFHKLGMFFFCLLLGLTIFIFKFKKKYVIFLG